MSDAGRFSQIARMHDQHVLVCRADDVSGFGVVMQELAGMKDRAGRQFEREHDAVRRLDEPAHTTTIDGAHRQFDDRQRLAALQRADGSREPESGWTTAT